MKKVLTVAGIVLAVGFVVIQFIRPAKNISSSPTGKELATVFPLPDSVQNILSRACYDCHSNTTRYPWYDEIQPVATWIGGHIRDGKQELNFDEYASYRPVRQYRRLFGIVGQIRTHKMPLPPYLFMHPSARLSSEDTTALVAWCAAMRDTMKARFPADSLERRPRRDQQR